MSDKDATIDLLAQVASLQDRENYLLRSIAGWKYTVEALLDFLDEIGVEYSGEAQEQIANLRINLRGGT